MRRLKSLSIGLIVILISLIPSAGSTAFGNGQNEVTIAQAAHITPQESPNQGAQAEPAPQPPAIQVTLSAAASTTSWDERDPERRKFDLPLLFLHRQRQATPAAERTLEVSIVGIPDGDEIEIEIVSHYENVSTGESHTETRRFVTPDRPCTTDAPCWFQWTFDSTTTPSDLYYLRVKDDAGKIRWENANRPAFVLLDTWETALGRGENQAYAARVYYATLFPFARGEHDLEDRLAPHAVTDFIARQFVPLIRDTWHTQVEEWGLGQPLHPDWDADNVIEIIVTAPPFALFEGIGTCTLFSGGDGRFSSQRRIWWLPSNNSFQNYDSLQDGYKVLFPHEFFHLLQWNTLLFTADPERYWYSWREGQATAVPTAQYPELPDSTYAGFAERFLTHRLNSSYQEMEANSERWHEAALYWRFLYEQYNDMDIFRAALEEMVRHQKMAIQADASQDNGHMLIAMKSALDAAFTRVSGPFHSYEESLVAFARANYALRLENGRCTATDFAECAGFYYDPESVYIDPPLETLLDYDGSPLIYDGAIPSSYGMDFIDVRLDPTVRGQPLTIRIEGDGVIARFDVQIWRLGPGPFKPRAVTLLPDSVPQNPDGSHEYVISRVDTTVYDRLALIITRLDPDETADPEGNYKVTLGTAATTDQT